MLASWMMLPPVGTVSANRIRRVVIPGEAGAAISQLTDAEQEAVRRLHL